MEFFHAFRNIQFSAATGVFLLVALWIPIHIPAQTTLPLSQEGNTESLPGSAYGIFKETQSSGPALRLFAEFAFLTVKPGTRTTLYLRGFIPDGWHIYSIFQQGEDGPYPTTIKTDSRAHLPVGALRESPVVRKWDGALEKELAVHLGTFTLEQDFHIMEDTSEGIHDLTGTLLFQACDNRICVPLRRQKFTAPLEIVR